MDTALAVRGISKRFGRRRVLDDVSLTICHGEIVALVGENGAGKSTLVRCIAGYEPFELGRVSVDGTTVTRADPVIGVVWQDLALCDNLDAVANLYLGRELGGLRLSEDAMRAGAAALLQTLGIHIDDLHRPAGLLSGGQRQGLAIARTLLERPSVLVLDEPTAALGVTESAAVERLLRRLRHDGVGILLVSHRIDQVFALADRVVVLRDGRIVADLPTREVHPDDVIALVSGVTTDSTARKQLRQLRSVVDQLAEVRPAASLPLIVSALSSALGVDQLCVHLVEHDRDGAQLTRRAALAISDEVAALTEVLPLDDEGSLPGRAAATASPAVTDDLRATPSCELDRRLAAAGALSGWAVPIIGTHGVLGVLSAFLDRVGTPSSAQLELVGLYANLAASAIERERLFDEVTRRNRVLESLRGMLDRLAGPAPADDAEGLGFALHPLCAGLGASAVAMFDGSDGTVRLRAAIAADGRQPSPAMAELLDDAAAQVAAEPQRVHARRLSPCVAAVPIALPHGSGSLIASWKQPDDIVVDAVDLLDDAARSLALAIERQAIDAAQEESATLRRSAVLQRELLLRLSHELRTPLTAIHGYTSTLRQTDVRWDDDTVQRFLERIADESVRMRRLVGDLLDSSAIESGSLRLQQDWCDVGLVLRQAVSCIDIGHDGIEVDAPRELPAIWGDHDRLEQVFVNLLDNAVRHGLAPVSVQVTGETDRIIVEVRDAGPGFATDIAHVAFEPHVSGSASTGAGLGLAIARGIVQAHGGTILIVVPDATHRATVRVDLPIEPDLHTTEAELGAA